MFLDTLTRFLIYGARRNGGILYRQLPSDQHCLLQGETICENTLDVHSGSDKEDDSPSIRKLRRGGNHLQRCFQHLVDCLEDTRYHLVIYGRVITTIASISLEEDEEDTSEKSEKVLNKTLEKEAEEKTL